MGCKEYELLKDTPYSKKGRRFIENEEGDYVPKDCSCQLDGTFWTWEYFSPEQVIELTEWFKPIEEEKEEAEQGNLEELLTGIDIKIVGIAINEALDRGIEYATKQGDDKTYISETRISFNVAECILQAMKAKT